MDTASPLLDISIDSPWFVNVAAEPLLQLLELHPHLNVTALAHSPPPNPFRLNLNHLERRSDCYNTNGNTSTTSSSGPSGALIGGIVGGVLGVLLLLILAFFLWRRSKNRKAQQPPPFVNNNVGVQPPMPMPYDPQAMNSSTPPLMQQTGGYDMNQGGGVGPGSNYTPAIYPAPPSTSGGWSSSNTNTGSAAGLLAGGGTPSPKPQDRQSYYNYAPPPVETIPGVFSVGNTAQFNHNSMLGTGGGTMYSGTPSPPPPSTTPGASSISGYAPWAIPHSTSPGPASSTAGPSSSAGSPPPGAQAPFGRFPSAADEKAHYSGLGEKNSAGFPNFPNFPAKEKEGQGSGGDDVPGTSPPARMGLQTPAPPAYSTYTSPPQQ